MGVLYDYFRAVDDATAVQLMADLDGGPVVTVDGRPGIDAIDLKGIDPAVTLGQLVALARGVPWQDDLVGERLLWNAGEEGPWLTSLDDTTRDTLASITPAQLPELSAGWGRTEELAWDGPLPADQMQPVVEAVAALARRARDAGESLYCWCCL
ncbi:hypothetical protein E0H26_00295 [Micromonospora zingiberis]|uniref:DUF1877 family protein n=1 Tax=Micromonospora zingiberis TaxID=2053011 RepID=A0A4R0GQU9_9ACTN|nr:hypothetical protein [Micromonospora zingiberis]TCC00185.1 hypothetical protein E0H26_00295 [Micromonospora zingiberis]